MVQVVGLYDAADGTVLTAPRIRQGPQRPQRTPWPDEILLSMDRYCGFVYHELISQLLDELSSDNSTPTANGVAQAQ